MGRQGLAKPAREAAYAYIFSSAGLIDLLAIPPVPIALLVGVPAATAWLLASLWLLKLAAFTPGLSLLQRVIALEAKPLASVLVIFLIVLLFAAIALYVLERTAQPAHFGSLPLSLWWAVTTLTGTGYGDAVPETVSAADRRLCHDLRPWGVRPLDRHSRHRLCHRIPASRLRAQLGPGDACAVPAQSRSVGDYRADPYAAPDRPRRAHRRGARGRPGDCMYFIASGEVEVMVEPQPVRLGPDRSSAKSPCSKAARAPLPSSRRSRAPC